MLFPPSLTHAHFDFLSFRSGSPFTPTTAIPFLEYSFLCAARIGLIPFTLPGSYLSCIFPSHIGARAAPRAWHVVYLSTFHLPPHSVSRHISRFPFAGLGYPFYSYCPSKTHPFLIRIMHRTHDSSPHARYPIVRTPDIPSYARTIFHRPHNEFPLHPCTTTYRYV